MLYTKVDEIGQHPYYWSTAVAILTGEIDVLGEKPVQCHFVYHKSQMDWSGIELEPPR